MPIGKLDIAMTLDAAGVSKGVRAAQKQIGVFGVAVGNFIGNVAARAFEELGRAIIGTFTDAIDTMEHFTDVAAGLGQGVEGAKEIRALQSAMIDMGTDAEASEDIITTFADAVGNLLVGKVRGGAKALKALGIELRNTDGTLKTMPEMIQETVNVLAGMEDRAAAAALAQQLFGKASDETAQILSQTGTAIVDQSRALEDGAADWVVFQANMEGIQKAGQNLVDDALTGLVGIINDLTPLITTLAQAFQDYLLPGLINLWTSIGDLITQIVDVVEEFVGWRNILAIVIGVAATMYEWWRQIIIIIGDLIDVVVRAGQAFGALSQIMAALATGNPQVIAAVWANVEGTFKAVGDAVLTLGDDYATAGAKALAAGADAAAGVLAAETGTKGWTDAVDELFASTNQLSTAPPITPFDPEAAKAGAAAAKELATQVDAYATSLNEAVDPMMVYREEMRLFDLAVAAGLTSIENRTAAVQLATEKAEQAASRLKKTKTAMEEFGEAVEKLATDTLAKELADAIVEGESLEDVFRNLIKTITKMALELLILKPILDAIIASIKSAFGGSTWAGDALGAILGAATQSGVQTYSAAQANTGRASRKSGRQSSSGTVVNSSMGALTINMGDGTMAGANSAREREWGQRVRGLIQNEIVRESRPGGLLWGRP